MKQIRGLWYLLGMTGFLLLIAYGAPFSWQLVTGQETDYPANTRVAGVSIAQLNREEAAHKLREVSENWSQNNGLMIELPSKSFVFDSDFITFSISKTLNQVEAGRNNGLVTEVDESYYSELKSEVPTALFDYVDFDRVSYRVKNDASQLKQQPMVYSIYDFIEPGIGALYETIASYSISVERNGSLSDLVNKINGIKFKPRSEQSFLSAISQQLKTAEVESLNQLATVLYGAVLETNFVVKQRHIHSWLPSYAELGKEASIKPKENQDLVLYNPNQSNYEVDFTFAGSELRAVIRGYPLMKEYRSRVASKQSIEPRTVVQLTSYVDPGEVQVKQEGQPGRSAVVYREIRGEEGWTTEKVTEDYYPPVNRVELRYGVEGNEGSSSPITDSPEGSKEIAPETKDEADSKNPKAGNEGPSNNNSPTDEEIPGEEDQFWEEDKKYFERK